MSNTGDYRVALLLTANELMLIIALFSVTLHALKESGGAYKIGNEKCLYSAMCIRGKPIAPTTLSQLTQHKLSILKN